MGQQQLLLLVIGIVIVGIAVVVGIQQFGEGSQKAELDRLTVEAVRMATGASAWRSTSVAMGGGRGDATFARFSLASLGFSNPTVIGSGEVSADATSIRSVWNRSSAATYVAVANAAYTAEAQVYLYGPGPGCLAARTRRTVGGVDVFTPAAAPAVPAGCAW